MPGTSRRWTYTIRTALFWSVISAAFIGPGTVTTAGSAGAQFGISLLWAIGVSIIATLVLQEAAARLTITTGMHIGGHLRLRFRTQKWIPAVIWLSVAFGCAAYEAGNILGAVSGIQILMPGSTPLYTVAVFGIAIMLLRNGDPGRIAKMLGILVAAMGMAFIAVSTQCSYTPGQILKEFFTPSLSAASTLLIIGLVGTTIVPYNLFLGSRLGQGQDLKSMRRGLSIAVVFGGLITMSILFCGTLISGAFEFESLASALESRLGQWAGYLFGTGLFAAGLTSSVTAPLAAAVTAQSIFPHWSPQSWPYRIVWMTVLLTGFVMGLLNFRPIPVILAAQMLNGMLLPFVVFVLFLVAFTPATKYTPARWHTMLAWAILVGVTFLGLHSVCIAIRKMGLWQPEDATVRLLAAIMAGLTGIGALFLMKGHDRTS